MVPLKKWIQVKGKTYTVVAFKRIVQFKTYKAKL